MRLRNCGKAGPMEVDRLWLKTTSHFLVSRNGGRTAAMIAVTGNGMPGKFEWEYNVEGHIWNMLVAGNRLYVVTREGKVYCFGERSTCHLQFIINLHPPFSGIVLLAAICWPVR
jgi:hypothetical protein